PLIFVRWAVTRDFPWVNIILSLAAVFLLFIGIRRAFAPGRRWLSKTISTIVTLISVLVLGLFVFTAFVASRWLPASANAPQVNQKAPNFTLLDANSKPVSLTELLLQPIDGGRPTKGVLLIFYRGYW